MSSSADLESGQAADRIAQALRQRLTQGLIPPGTPMRDGVLAREFEVSRNTMREALRRLESEGLLAHQMHKGVSVRRMDVADVRDAFTVRRAVEIRAIEESALVDQRQLDALLEPIAAGEAAALDGAWRVVGTCSLEFHQRLVGLLASPTLDDLFAIVVARLRLIFAVMPDEADFQKPWPPRDREIAEALIAGRRETARSLLRVYLTDSERSSIDVVRATHANSR